MKKEQEKAKTVAEIEIQEGIMKITGEESVIEKMTENIQSSLIEEKWTGN